MRAYTVDRYGSTFASPDGRRWTRTETCNERSPKDGTPCSLPAAHGLGHSWERAVQVLIGPRR
jgi:hypothetical protein